MSHMDERNAYYRGMMNAGRALRSKTSVIPLPNSTPSSEYSMWLQGLTAVGYFEKIDASAKKVKRSGGGENAFGASSSNSSSAGSSEEDDNLAKLLADMA